MCPMRRCPLYSTKGPVGDTDGFEWSYAGGRHLKGVKGETKLFRARRSGA